MLKFINEHKSALGIAAIVTGIAAYYLRHRAPFVTKPSLMASLVKDRKREVEIAAKEKAFKGVVLWIKQKIKENASFIESQLGVQAPVNEIKDSLNESGDFKNISPLLQVVTNTFASLFLQRFVHLLQIVRLSIHQKRGLPQFAEEVKEKQQIKQEEDAPKISPMIARIKIKNPKLVQNEAEPAAFCQIVIQFCARIVREVGELVKGNIREDMILLSNGEGSGLIPNLFGKLKEMFCLLACGKNSDPLEISSYRINIVNIFGEMLREAEKTQPSFVELRGFVESSYFQSLFLQGADIDFRDFNAEYQKMVTLAFQGRIIDEKINVKDVVASVLKARKEWVGKVVTRYGNEIDANTESDYIDKMLKFIATELNQQPGEAVSESYKQSLKEFIIVTLFEEEVKSLSVAQLPSLADLDFANS